MHWCDKATARANIAHALMARSAWTVYGYKPDRSDSMTDYYDPADWYEGAAVHTSGIILVIDRYQGHAKDTRTRVRYVPDPSRPCPTCNTTGKREPDQGQRNHAVRWGLDPNHCIACDGRGHLTKAEDYEEPFVSYQATPKHAAWHLERDGQILVKGTGVFTCQTGEKARSLVDKIEATIAKLTGPDKPSGKAPETPASLAAAPETTNHQAANLETGSTVTRGRPGNLEIRFAAKPSEEIRSELKAAGYHWLGKAGLWYGPEATLPARYPRPETGSPAEVLPAVPGSGGVLLQFPIRAAAK